MARKEYNPFTLKPLKRKPLQAEQRTGGSLNNRSTLPTMRALQFSLTFGFMLLLSGCSKEHGIPLSFYLSDSNQSSTVSIPTNTAVLVVSELAMVAAEPAEGRVTIKLLPPDASVFEKLTTDNLGKRVVVVQGTNVIAAPTINAPIPVQAGIMLPIRTNVDFELTYRNLWRLSRQ